MTEQDPDILSEEEAARLWERAAQLQAESTGETETPDVQDARIHTPGYALTHVRSAALEAGIDSEYVETALAELRADRSLPQAGTGSSLARKFLKDPPNTITARRIIDASPDEVFSAMEVVFPREPFRLALADRHGDPLDGGMVVFDVPELNNPFERGFVHEMRDAGLKQAFVSLKSVDDDFSCEVTVYSPVTSHRIGLALGTFIATLTGGAGLGVGLLGGAALGGLGMASGLLPVVAAGPPPRS